MARALGRSMMAQAPRKFSEENFDSLIARVKTSEDLGCKERAIVYLYGNHISNRHWLNSFATEAI
jgi:hypothetical protein